MFAIIGLGNPGLEYELTRHNAGFWVVAELLRRSAYSGSPQSKFKCEYAKVSLAGGQQLLVAPQAFMNLSGEVAVPLLKFFKIPPEQVIVIHDELDLPPGVIRVKRGGQSRSHNGIADIVSHLNNSDFYRIKVGIGHPKNAFSGEEEGRKRNFSVNSWVLGRPGSAEQELLNDAVLKAADAVEEIIRNGLVSAQRKFNTKASPNK